MAHFPPTGTEASGTQHVQVCDGSALPNGDDSKVYAIRTNGALSYEVLDVTDPATPQFLRTIAETGVSSRPESERGNRETHKFQWDCATGIAYLNGTAPGWRVTRVLQAFDLGDPSAPKHVRDFGLAGYEPTSTEPYPEPQVAGLHQPFVVGNRMYLGYNSGEEGTLQIVDRDEFLRGDATPTAANLRAPRDRAARSCRATGACTPRKPIYDFEIADYADNREARTRDLLLVASEAGTFRCQEPRDVLLIFDITEEAHAAADCDVPSARGARRLLSSRRAVRPALVRRRVSPGVRPRSWSCSRTSTPACASSTSAIRSSRRKSRASFPR